MYAIENWLNEEDSRCYEDRLSRLEWLANNVPGGEYWISPGGLLAKSLFEEARYCFVYGQFLATILLGLAYIERTLAALLYSSGRNDLERASFSTLLSTACDEKLITSSEFQDLERIRQRRNAYAHFRKPLHKDSVEIRAFRENEMPYNVIEQDATVVIAAAFDIVAKTTV